MQPSLLRSVRFVFAVGFVAAGVALVSSSTGCANPPPECAPRGESFTICADEAVWTCPVGDADVVAFNEKVDADCQTTADPIQCIVDAEYKNVEMTLAADCGAGGEVCVESMSTPSSASCEKK